MKRNNRVLVILFFIFIVSMSVTACEQTNEGEHTESSNVDEVNQSYGEYFMWDGNIIYGLTEIGKSQKKLVIPKECEGFDGMMFTDEDVKVEYVVFESDKDIDLNCVFGGAKTIKKIELPENLSQIGDMEFWLCSSLESIVIPQGVTVIGEAAFEDCQALRKVAFEGELKEIKMHAFDGCVFLSEIELPNSIVEIGKYAFANTKALERITVPEALKLLGAYAFSQSGIKEIVVPQNVELEAYDETAIALYDHDITVYIVEDSWADKHFDELFEGAFIKKYHSN